MRAVVRLLVGSSLAIAAVVVTAGMATADDEGGAGGTSSAFVSEGGDPTAVAREASNRAGRSSGSGASNCEWRLITADDTKFAIYDADGTRLHSDTGRWFEKWCDGEL